MKQVFLVLVALVQVASAGVLDSVRDRVISAVKKGDTPVVVFDIDDTLTDSRERTLRILRDVMKDPGIAEAYPQYVGVVNRLRYREIEYELKDTLRLVGIVDEGFVKRLTEEWAARFFSNGYVGADRPLAGAIEYVKDLHSLGAHVVYLTGRDKPRMEAGTRRNFRRLGFPSDGRTSLRMKADKAIADLVFKQSEIAWIGQQGNVVGVFENEPANLNLLAESFPESLPVFLDTTHSPKPIEPVSFAVWLLDYL